MDSNERTIMVMDTEYSIPETKNYKCFKLGNIMYIPHYEIPGLFVGPSKRTETGRIKAIYERRSFYKDELVRMGAAETYEQLWSTSARDQK
jgi:hypothetical protein